MDSKELLSLSERYLMATYRRYPLVVVRGDGSRVWDAEGREYLDFVSGLAVCNLGHSHPGVVEALKDQASRLLHISNLYHIEPQIRLAQVLCNHSFADRVFFCNSGAEANEGAIKLVRKYFHDRGEGRYRIITAHGSFHGRTLATLTATGQERFHRGFEPLPDGFDYVPFNDVEALEGAIGPETAAVMLEPIQGEGGVNLPSPDYLREVRSLCEREGILLILDEVQTGIGRTGRLFACEHYGVEPDVMTLAKGLGGGVPIGAVLAREEVAKAFTPGSHASTFGGNPLSTRAGLAVMEAVLEGGFLERVEEMGTYLMEGLEALRGTFGFIKEVRGKGLMVGMELTVSGGAVVEACLERGLLINCTAEKVLRFLPPLTVSREEVDRMLCILEEALSVSRMGVEG